MPPELTGAQKSHLRGLAQTLEPKVFVGKDGVTPSIAKLLEDAFRRADLVKVRFVGNRETVAAQAADLAGRTSSARVGSVGRTAAFYRKGTGA
jgi:RNA-binding protein